MFDDHFLHRSAHPALMSRVASRWLVAGPLTDVSNLRYQAVFMMGAGGSGKGFVSHRWLKYMPGGGSSGYVNRDVWKDKIKEKMDEKKRSLSNLNFEKVLNSIQDKGIEIEFVDPQVAKIPFRLYTYDQSGREHLIPPERWDEELPPAVYREVEGLTEVVFGTPVHELPSYWRQVNPDIYKEELAGYLETQPGYVHEMSSDMSKAYLDAALESGDPVFVDGTGSNLKKMVMWFQMAKDAGYKTSVVFVYVPLTINQIRNATRARNVKAEEVVRQWKIITKNYARLRVKADKAHFVDNRNDPEDIAKWNKRKDEINSFIRRSTGGRYQDLYELVAEHAPQELSRYGKLLRS